ncbi:MAG: RagB/SusD family nutrient uptake outer membrane protein [Mangrovibacterium sp.]
MKKTTLNIVIIIALAATFFLPCGCTKDLLDQEPTTELGAAAFWQTEQDATTALLGTYTTIRPLFDRDYYLDGHGEYTMVRGVSSATALTNGSFGPSGYGGSFDTYFTSLYGGVNSTNYVIENVRRMLPAASRITRPGLETVLGEARLLRGMVYLRLISMWGDVPYINKVIYPVEADILSRTPIAVIKDSIMADFTYAIEKLPVKASAFGRAAKPAALAFRGKLQLYWACWNKFGWPELDMFTPSASEAESAYKAAAADFKSVINDYGLTLFRNGEPGETDDLGKAEKLPNYYYLFVGSTGNNVPEILMSFPHGTYGTNQGVEELVRDFGGRLQSNSQNYIVPCYEIADRYQSTITGDFCDPLIPMNPATPGARTQLNSAVNPQSYANRDYRMKASMMWDYEMMLGTREFVVETTGWNPYIYKTWAAPVTINGVNYTSYNGATNTGYVARKFVRNYGGLTLHRSYGDYAWPVMRLADVYLMYAEASNEAYGPQADAIELVNKVRHRGNLPALASDKTATKETFFSAIEQERIVELFAEGHRGFDLRRWRALERVWGPPYSEGKILYDTHGAQITRRFQNASERVYEQCYIFRIPPKERDRNPNLTQNTPWL